MAKKTLAAAACAAAFAVLTAHAADVLESLHLTPEQAKDELLSALAMRSVPVGNVGHAFLALDPATRGTVVTEFAAWAKAYLATPEFRQVYLSLRDNAKPTAPAATTVDAEYKRQHDEQLQQFVESRRAMAALAPEQRKAMEAALDRAMAQANDPKMQERVRSQIKDQIASREKQYQSATKAWQEQYPLEPQTLLAMRLREFLTTCESVDFGAKLEEQGGRKLFFDPAYESKSSEWKMCFRAGREATTAARTAALAWLGEIGK